MYFPPPPKPYLKVSPVKIFNSCMNYPANSGSAPLQKANYDRNSDFTPLQRINYDRKSGFAPLQKANYDRNSDFAPLQGMNYDRNSDFISFLRYIFRKSTHLFRVIIFIPFRNTTITLHVFFQANHILTQLPLMLLAWDQVFLNITTRCLFQSFASFFQDCYGLLHLLLVVPDDIQTRTFFRTVKRNLRHLLPLPAVQCPEIQSGQFRELLTSSSVNGQRPPQ